MQYTAEVSPVVLESDSTTMHKLFACMLCLAVHSLMVCKNALMYRLTTWRDHYVALVSLSCVTNPFFGDLIYT